MPENCLQISLADACGSNNNLLFAGQEYAAALNLAVIDKPATILYLQNNSTAKKIPLDKFLYQFLKRSIDILFSFIVIIFILPWLAPIIAALIKWSSKGPVFFLQKRNGKNGKLFTCIKFRTMIINAESDKKAACENDCRITHVGKFLRHFRLDELPQFINVLKGEMTIIGPRPHMINENLFYEKLIDNYSFRHKVKPGISGLAQVAGYAGVAGLPEMRQRIRLDILYINNWSPALDIKIMCRTIFLPVLETIKFLRVKNDKVI